MIDQETRKVELDLIKQKLLTLGQRSQEAKSLPDDRISAVKTALTNFTRAELSVIEIANLVDVKPQRIYQIKDSINSDGS